MVKYRDKSQKITMADEKQQPEISPKPSDNLDVETLDPGKKAEKLAEQQLEMKQKGEKKALDADHQEKANDVQAKAAENRADVLVSTPDKPAATNDTPTPTPDQPTAAPADSPAPAPAPANTPANAPAVTADSPAPANAPQESKDMWGKVKEFFSDLGDKITAFFNKLFGGKDGQPAAGSEPAAANAPASSPDAPISGPDSTAGLTGDNLLNHPQFKERAQQIATKIGVSLADLYAIFKMEGVTRDKGVDPQAVNPTSGASGLIQWMPKYAPVPIEDLRKMTGLQQLEFVDKHFSPHAGKIKSFADMYALVFWPAAVGKPADYIFGAPDMEYAKKVAQQNSGIAKFSQRSDGLIDKAGFDRYANSRRPKDSAIA
ncbi:hypothetical protein IT411_01065 [Candidatus Peregrinibacteria bacterium]|nr:hypothetical protein [Candidatus Peregrinibacteria bacterium]